MLAVRAGLASVALLLADGCVRAARGDAPYAEQLGEVLGEGVASYYGGELEGRRTASGEAFDPSKMTAAHRSLPFGTCLTVINLENQRRVKVRVNDRGPFAQSRILDLSQAAAARLGMLAAGIARVRLYRCGGPG